VLFGTHVSGPGKGFSVADFDTSTGALTNVHFLLEAPAPAYFVLAKNETLLYSCNSDDFISAYRVDRSNGTLEFINRHPSGGGDRATLVWTELKNMSSWPTIREEASRLGG